MPRRGTPCDWLRGESGRERAAGGSLARVARRSRAAAARPAPPSGARSRRRPRAEGARGGARRPPVSGRRPPGSGAGRVAVGTGGSPAARPGRCRPPGERGLGAVSAVWVRSLPRAEAGGPTPRCARPQSPQPGCSCPVEAGGACSAGLCSAACAGRGFRGKKINKKGWLPVEAARRVFLRGNSQNRAVWWWQLWACTGCSCVSTAKRGPRGSWSLGKFRAWRCDPWRRRKALGCLCVF